jgi:hypothetical protein
MSDLQIGLLVIGAVIVVAVLLFNWIQEKTGIECASKVRSFRGLLVHVFARLAAAMFLLNARPQSA